MPDIDIDFADRSKILNIIRHVPASISYDKKHNTGVYVHSIPIHPLSGASSIPYQEAEQRGYFKIDFLNVGIYKDIRNEEHLNLLLNKEPLWDLLEQDDFVTCYFTSTDMVRS